MSKQRPEWAVRIALALCCGAGAAFLATDGAPTWWGVLLWCGALFGVLLILWPIERR